MFNNFLVLLLLFSVIYKLKIHKPISEINSEYLSPESCIPYRGLLAIVVVFGHLVKDTTSGILFCKFVNFGGLAVSVFFFYSGFGLMKSYLTKPNYSGNIFRKRIPCLAFIYAIFIVIYVVVDLFCGISLDFKHIIHSIEIGQPIVSYSWYIISILFFYFSFGIATRLFNKKRRIITSMLFFYILYVFILIKINYGQWWYNTAFSLIIGLIWAYKEDKLNEIINRLYFIIFPVSFFSFAGLFYLYDKITFLPYFILETVTSSLFAVSVIIVSMKIRIGNKILNHLGCISLELYLVHGLFIELFHSEKIYIQNEFLFCASVILCSIIVGTVLHYTINEITKYLFDKKSKSLNPTSKPMPKS